MEGGVLERGNVVVGFYAGVKLWWWWSFRIVVGFCAGI